MGKKRLGQQSLGGRNHLGRLIVLEGPDGVGKSTIAGGLVEGLRAQGQEVTFRHFPGQENGTLGKLVYSVHHDLKGFGVNDCRPASLQLLHVAAHIDLIENQILPAIERGDTVVLDRYWWSTYAYGLEYGVPRESLELMIRLEEFHWRRVLPSYLFLITRNEPFRRELTEEQWQRIQKCYRELADQENRHPVRVIENMGDVEDSIKEVLECCAACASPRKQPNKRCAPKNAQSLFNLNEPVHSTPSSGNCTSIENEEHEQFLGLKERWAPAEPTPVFLTYWKFAAKRQDIFFDKLAGGGPPWTDDPVLSRHKFTNAYRASDRVSQFLIRHVIYEGSQKPEEVFFRIVLFKLFNKIETWKLLERAVGPISWAQYSFDDYEAVLSSAMQRKQRIYSAAYVMPSCGLVFGYARKHANHLKLLETMMANGLPRELQEVRTMQEGFELLVSYPSIGDFLAYQFITDINYSAMTSFTEMEFVIPGPGARDGIRKCFSRFGGLNENEIIKLCAEWQSKEFARLEIEFKSLWGRPLQLIDCQNLFCEVDKYARVMYPQVKGRSGRTRIKQLYRPNREQIEYWYPPKWGINESVRETMASCGMIPT